MTRTAIWTTFTLSVLLAASTPAFAQKERTIANTIATNGIRAVEVRGDVGSILVTASARHDIQLSVRLKGKTSRRLFSRQTGDPDQLQLRQDRRGDVLELSLSGFKENIEEDWLLEVPEELAARLAVTRHNLQPRYSHDKFLR